MQLHSTCNSCNLFFDGLLIEEKQEVERSTGSKFTENDIHHA